MTNAHQHDDDSAYEADYEVGYKKPPESGQFKLGHKRAKGRPKGSKNAKTIARMVFFEKISYLSNGKKVKAEAFEVMLRKLRGKALEGDLRAITQVASIIFALDPPEQEAPPPELTEAERAVMGNYLALQQMMLPDNDDE